VKDALAADAAEELQLLNRLIYIYIYIPWHHSNNNRQSTFSLFVQ
jgi:hypothetical protein